MIATRLDPYPQEERWQSIGKPYANSHVVLLVVHTDPVVQPDGDDTIDLSDMPEVQDWSGTQRGQFYKPKKLQKTLRIDADVLAWFEAQGPGHLTRMNRALRAAMLMEIRRKKKGEAA
jgi:uncharacterized protein (DUF4415 family)